MQNKKKINLGIIGKNFGYNVIYKAFLKNINFKILGFSFKSKKNYKIKIPKKIKLYRHWKKMILDKSIDAIVIATPPRTHGEIIKFALKYKKHIFCEKPLTCSVNEAKSIYNLTLKRKNISHIVNYEFAEISAFQFFKKRILSKKIKKEEIHLTWLINVRKKNNNWKENHQRGGGLMFNYVCHTIYYLEYLFGKIRSIESKISFEKNKKINSLYSVIFFKSGLSTKLIIKILPEGSNAEPIHELKVISNNDVYTLKSKVDSVTDQFEIIKLNRSSLKTSLLFKNKKNKSDFRIEPTMKNSIKFSSWILNRQIKRPNFFDAYRIHSIIDKMFYSSKNNKKMFIN